MTQTLATSTPKPLPPQRWGILPTNQFWGLAALTPIALIYYLGLLVYFPLLDHLGLVWWQVALALWLYHEIWGGLVERYARGYLARRQRLQAAAVAAPALNSSPGVNRRPRVPAFAAEDWDVYYARIYGRFSGVVQLTSELEFLLLLFYPGWVSKALAAAWLIGSFLIARAVTHRWKAAALVARSYLDAADRDGSRVRALDPEFEHSAPQRVTREVQRRGGADEGAGALEQAVAAHPKVVAWRNR
ncbi:hypothetical protein [Nannocystis pusilla]|uniref:Uncharacterized protein n=1 Tax=Nannocystis pusilla TaxID=889268 RepID=A0ABS7TPF5_9BACT|nr:hypothetical protein [Nannocystis pusilla]MBZ5710108.1 hypothetical protein [Nannocystis pusilla]